MTDDTHTRQAENEDVARLQRQQMLTDLAREMQAGGGSSLSVTKYPSGRASLRPPRSLRSRSWRVALAVILGVAVAGGALSYYALRRSTQPAVSTIHPLLIQTAQNGIACPQDVAWSPSGTMIAVLGYQQHCPNTAAQSSTYPPGQVDIYSAATGTRIAQILPYDPIAQNLHLTSPMATSVAHSTSHQITQYGHVLWSSDGKLLAISFSVTSEMNSAGNLSLVTDGVLLTDVAGTFSRTLFHSRSPFEVYSGEWNLTTGAYLPIPIDVEPYSWYPVPPAMSYAWDSDGSLAVQGQLLSLISIPSTSPLGPIGNPDGDSSFTVWQPAIITPIVGTGGNTSINYLYGAHFPAWSPDGSHLILDVDVFDLLVTDRSRLPSAANLASQRIAARALLPARDKGLTQILADASRTMPGSTGSIQVLWRPDGRIVATPLQPSFSPRDPASAAPEVRLYDCATGQLLSTLREPIQPTSQESTPVYVRWSPDGSHLLLLDSEYGTLALWSLSQLPHS